MNKTTTWDNLEKEKLPGKLVDQAKNISRKTVENTNQFLLKTYNKLLQEKIELKNEPFSFQA